MCVVRIKKREREREDCPFRMSAFLRIYFSLGRKVKILKRSIKS